VSVARLHRLKATYGNDVDFVAVYVREAHACDQWPLGKAVVIPQHSTLSDRIAAARRFKEETAYEPTLLVDTMNNCFDEEYACWPERGFIIHESKIAYVCALDSEGALDWEDGIEEWLAARYPRST